MTLYDTIQSLRLSGGLVYDRGKSAGMTDEEVAVMVAPIRQRMENEIKTGIEDLREASVALALLQGDAEAHQAAIEMLQGKIHESRQYAAMIHRAIRDRIESAGELGILDRDTSATLVSSQDGPRVTIR